MLFLLLCLFVPYFSTADNEEIASILINNSTNETSGPTLEWIAEVAEGMKKFAISGTRSSRIAAVRPTNTELESTLNQYRSEFGPRNNMTPTSNSETDPALRSFALEGDMILNPEQIDTLLKTRSSGIAKRAVTTNVNALWTVGKPIAYYIDPSLNSIVSKIRAGVKFWNDNSCLSFTESSTITPRIRYYRGQGCWSYVGKQNGWTSQDISIGTGCESHGTICHETAHAMGFFHTQSRYDRDDYLTINFNNIQSSLTHNFLKKAPGTETHFGIPYDYGSVMQYDPYAFAIDYSLPTSVARNKFYQNAMGQREEPSFSDVIEMNLLYKCESVCSSKPTCYNKGIVNPNTCRDCLCPRYYTGANCQSLKPGNAPVCNGRTVQATSTSFTQLNATVGLGMTYKYSNVDKAADCFWLIQAATGKRLQLQVSYLNTQCMESCPWGGFEINLGNIEQYGMVTCCSSVTSQYFTTVGNIAVIRGYSRYNNVNMILNYRVV